MSNVKRFCPHCGGDKFKGVFKQGALVEINEKGEISIIKKSNKSVVEIAECAACKAKVTENDLVETAGVKCSECGKLHKEEELTNGLCPVCDAKKNRKDIANASQDELIARILKLEQMQKTKDSESKTVEPKDEKPKTNKTKTTKVKQEKAETKASPEPQPTPDDSFIEEPPVMDMDDNDMPF